MQNKTNPEPLGAPMAKLVLAVAIIVCLGALFGAIGYLAMNKPVKIQQPQISPAAEPVISDSENLDFYQIHELKQNKDIAIGNFITDGYVVKIYTCPPCPKDALCKMCMGNNIVISENNNLLNAYLLTDRELIIFTDNPNKFELNKKYRFSIEILNYKSTGEPLNDIRLIEYEIIKNEAADLFPKASATEDWKTYRNEEYGYEVKYPKNWEINEYDKYIKFSDGSEYFSVKYYDDISIFTLFSDSLNEYFENQNLELTENKGIVDIAGEKFYKISQHECPKAMHTCFRFYTEKDKHIYEIEYEFENDIAAQMISSLSFRKIKDEIIDWKIYRNEEYGFEFKYPKEWTVEEKPLSVYPDVFTIRAEFKSPSKDKQFFIEVRPRDNEGMIREAYNIISETKINIGEITGSKIIGTGQKEGSFRETFALVTKGDYVYNFYLPPFYQEEIFLDQILSTFKFTEKDETADWQTYRNEEYGFELKYPEDFYLEEPAIVGSEMEYPDVRSFYSLDLHSTMLELNDRDWDSVFILVEVHHNGFELLPLGTDLTNAKEGERIEEALQMAYAGKKGIVTYKKIDNREEYGRVNGGSLFYYTLLHSEKYNYSIGIHLPYSIRKNSADEEIRKFVNNYNQILSAFKFIEPTETSIKIQKPDGYIPLVDIASSDEKLSNYLKELYCGIECCGLSSTIYTKKLVKNYPDFFISECGGGGTCTDFKKTTIYLTDKNTGTFKIVWDEDAYIWAAGSPPFISSNIEFTDIDNDGNVEIIKNVSEMKCDTQCAKQDCCWPEDFCEGEEVISKQEYKKVFKWDNKSQKFIEIINN